MPSKFDEPTLKAALSRLPTQIERIDGYAVPSATGSWIKRRKAKWFRCSGIDDLPDVDIEIATHQRQLVDEAYIHSSKGVLEQLHHLSHFGG